MKDLLHHFRGELRQNEPLAQRSSVRVGGSADCFAKPADVEDLRVLLAACAEAAVPVSVLGGGANTLVADAGVEGVVLRLPSWEGEATWVDDAGLFVLGAGTPIAKVPQLMKQHRLLGGEFLAGIPGTLGGAVSMNAGTKQGESERVIDAVEVVDAGGARWLRHDELSWRYRHCELPPGSVVSRVRVRLQRADEQALAASKQAMEADLAYRKSRQPLQLPNSGSVFTNPPGDHAGRLIEACGLKGTRRGNAQISELHANFIVNHGGALASDVRFLIELARGEVAARFGVALEPEVKLLGRWQEWKA
jgi:UDP-N-acetylmuramate dehydrogenase